MTDSIKDKKILLIDDEVGVIKALSLLLKALGATAFCISDPGAAIEHIGSEEVRAHDVILSDLRMPDFDGMDMLAKRNEHCPDIPFILISGHASKQEIEQALSNGANGFLAKPFSPDELRSLFNELNL